MCWCEGKNWVNFFFHRIACVVVLILVLLVASKTMSMFCSEIVITNSLHFKRKTVYVWWCAKFVSWRPELKVAWPAQKEKKIPDGPSSSTNCSPLSRRRRWRPPAAAAAAAATATATAAKLAHYDAGRRHFQDVVADAGLGRRLRAAGSVGADQQRRRGGPPAAAAAHGRPPQRFQPPTIRQGARHIYSYLL